jgi:hypothetical protein
MASGVYTSKSCGARGYARVVTLDAVKKTVAIDDRVSPCPPDVQCVWSGIVSRRGTFAVVSPDETGKPFRLDLDLKPNANKQGQPPPAQLEWYPSRGVLTEPGDTCPYTTG